MVAKIITYYQVVDEQGATINDFHRKEDAQKCKQLYDNGNYPMS